MSAPQLRQASLADLAGLMRLEALGFAPAIQESADCFAERLSVFPAGNRVLDGGPAGLLGYCCTELWPWEAELSPARFARDHAASATHRNDGEEVYISSMVLDPVLRGGGWGQRLFQGTLDAVRAAAPRVHSAVLIVHPHWQGARHIYQRSGFQEVGSLPGYFGAEQAILMRCSFRT